MPSRPDDPLLAVVSPPRVERFRELAGIEPGESVIANFTGWSKLVLLTRDLAVLFPRDAGNVAPLRWEVEALQAVAPAGLAEVPEVVAEWNEVGISAYPVVAIQRLPGTPLEELLPSLDVEPVGWILEQIGRLAARWHDVDPTPLAERPPRTTPHREGLDALLAVHPDAPAPAEAAAHVRRTLRLDDTSERRGRAAITRARTLEPVLVHADIHEGQLLVDPVDYRVTGVLDWQTAVVDHPFTEFNFGEWGETLWQQHRGSFPALRRRQWDAYAAGRGLADDLGPVLEWVYSVSHALWLEAQEQAGAPARPQVTGTREEAFERVLDATRALGV